MGWTRRCAQYGLLLLGLGLPAHTLAHAQDDAGPRGGGAFAGGQMIRGTVTAVGEKLTLKTDDGTVYQVVTTANTRIMKDRQPIKLADIPVGSSVGAMGLLDAPSKTVHAMAVMVVDPEQARKAREGMGKLYIMGKVTKIDETTLTILRSDNVTQKIEVDESTSFKRGGGGMRAMMGGGPVGVGSGDAAPVRNGPPAESITLMDIKVGDQVAGQGAVKNGVFVPKELNVVPPGTGQRRRRNAEGAGQGASPGASPSAGDAQPATPPQ